MAIASNKSQAQTQQVVSHHDLYEQDFCLWIEQAVKLLSENRLSELDRENLIEEISDMGSSQKQGLESNLEVVLAYAPFEIQISTRKAIEQLAIDLI